MSLHINMTEEAEHKLVWQKRKTLAAASFTAFLCFTLLVVLLYIAVIIIPAIEEPEVVAYETNNEESSPTERPVTNERTRSRPSFSSQSQANIITTSTPTDTPVVSVEVDMPDADIAQGMGLDLGSSWGDDGGTDGTGFGSTTAGGTALEGIFYDFKQTKSGDPTEMSPGTTLTLLKEFITKKWNPSLFSKYYNPPTKLYASQFYIPLTPAINAPKAYKCEATVKDGRWCAVYRGKVMAPKSGKFRFVGAADDCVIVRFNNELVFDYGWYVVSLGRRSGEVQQVMSGKQKNEALKKEIEQAGVNMPPVKFYQYGTSAHWNGAIGGLAAGKTFEVKAGEVYPIEILISELPGGEFALALLIEDLASPPTKKDAKLGTPVFPLFRTNYALPTTIKDMKGQYVPFDEVGPVFQAVK